MVEGVEDDEIVEGVEEKHDLRSAFILNDREQIWFLRFSNVSFSV